MAQFRYASAVLPGQRVNLMGGLRPDANQPFGCSLAAGVADPLAQILEGLDAEHLTYELPELTPCRTWTDLVSAFFAGYTVPGRPASFAGAAALQRYSSEAAAQLTALTRWFGLDPKDASDQADASFVLARVNRCAPDSTASVASPAAHGFNQELHQSYTRALTELCGKLQPPGGDPVISLHPGAVADVLQFVTAQFGSHFVESVSIGDQAFQVLVFTHDKFNVIRQAAGEKAWSGISALGFRYWTQFCKYGTPVRLLSGNRAFAEVTPLLRDDTFRMEQSIFNLVLNEEAHAKAAQLDQLTCIGMRLAPVTALHATDPTLPSSVALTPDDRDGWAVAALVDNVTVQGFVCRFGGGTAGPAAYLNNNTIDYSALYAPFSRKDTVSLLWSPYLSVSQMYVRLDDLWQQQAMNKEGVRHLIIVADVIEVGGVVDLSLVESVTLVCRLFIARATEDEAPTVKLSGSAWDPLQFYCGSMIGTCVFQSASADAQRRCVFDSRALAITPDKDAVAYDAFFAGHFPAAVLHSTDPSPSAEWRRDSIATGLESLLLSAAVMLSPQARISAELKAVATEGWHSLQWILACSGEIVKAAPNPGKLSSEIRQTYAHATALSLSVADPATTGEVLPAVPPLRYTAFKDAVDRMLDVAQDYAKQIDKVNAAIALRNEAVQRRYDQAQLNENIRSVAIYLIDQNDALATNEQDLADYHNTIIDKQNIAITQLRQREEQIRSQLQAQATKLEAARDALQKALADKLAKAGVDLAIEFVLALTEAVGGVWFGGVTWKKAAGTGAERMLKQLKSFLEAVALVEKLADMAVKGVNLTGDLMGAVAATAPGALEREAPTEADWELLLNDAELQVRFAREHAPEKTAAYLAALRSLVAVGKSLIPVLQQKGRLAFDVFSEEGVRDVGRRQADRLKQLKEKLTIKDLEPGVDYVADLGRFNAVLQQRQNAILLRLTRLAALQDGAMSYFYLSQPTVITRYDLSSLRQGLLAQSLEAVRALATYPQPPTDLKRPVTYTIENVSVADLLSDTGAAVEIPMTAAEFLTYARVRINAVDVRVSGVSTGSGKCHVMMVSDGNRMQDRDLRREPLTFQTVSREWHVVYELESGETVVGTVPATEWGQFFNKLTPFQTWRIRLPKTVENKALTLPDKFTTVTLQFMLEAVYSSVPLRHRRLKTAGLRGAGAAPPDFIQLLEGRSITDGWDVVTFASVDQINALWHQRWLAETAETFKGDSTFLQRFSCATVQNLPFGSVKYVLDAKAGPPALTFLANEPQTAWVTIPLVGGQLLTIQYKGKNATGEELGREETPITSSPAQMTVIKGKAQLAYLRGRMDEEQSVCIDPLKGVWDLDTPIELTPTIADALATELVAYLKKRQMPPWKLGTVRIPANRPYLRPSAFQFRTFVPPKSRPDWPAILGLYILTSTPSAPVQGMRVSWPDTTWPASATYDATVYFSADLLWKQVISDEVRRTFPNAALTRNADRGTYTMAFAGTARVYEKLYPIMSTAYTEPPRGTVTFDFSWITMSLSMTQLSLSCDHTWVERFPFQDAVDKFDLKTRMSSINYFVNWSRVTFTCRFNGSVTPALNPETTSITFPRLALQPVIKGIVEDRKLLGFIDLPHAEQSAADAAGSELRRRVQDWQIDLGSLSLFAVSNLLFPESKTIEPKAVFFPGDMVLIGNVSRQWQKPT